MDVGSALVQPLATCRSHHIVFSKHQCHSAAYQYLEINQLGVPNGMVDAVAKYDDPWALSTSRRQCHLEECQFCRRSDRTRRYQRTKRSLPSARTGPVFGQARVHIRESKEGDPSVPDRDCPQINRFHKFPHPMSVRSG